jgi:hypothetical protein
MTLRQGEIINSDLLSGWETASPYGGRMVIKRQEQGGKGNKPRTKRGDLVEQVTKVSASEGIFEAS